MMISIKEQEEIEPEYVQEDVTQTEATFLVGALLMGFAQSFGFLMAGRVIAGIGTGYSLMIAPVYTAEISPASSRGFIGSLPEVFINVGLLLGYVVNYALTDLPKNINWRLMLGIAAVPALGIIIGVLLMPESPRWLIMKGREEEARDVHVKTSEGGEAEADSRLAEILEHNERAATEWNGEGVWKELILRPSKAVRRILIAAIGLNFFMQASGNDAVVYYTPEVFKKAGVQDRKQQFSVNLIMGSAKTLSVLVSALFLYRFGRRPLLLLGSAGMTISLTGLGLGTHFLDNSVEKPKWDIALSIVAVCADVSFFSIGLGPVTWLYSSEIFPMRLRAQGSSIAITVNRLVSGLVTIFFPAVSREITFARSFFIFAGVAAAGTIFFYVFLPETKGKNLEDIEDLFDSQRGGQASEINEDFNEGFWIRLAARTETCVSEDDKKDYEELALAVMNIVDLLVHKTKSRDKLLRALRGMNAGDAADQVIRKVDKMVKSGDRVSRDYKFNKEDQHPNQISITEELTKKRPMLQDGNGPTSIDDLPAKRPFYGSARNTSLPPQMATDSVRENITVNGTSDKVPFLDGDSNPVEQMIAMIGIFLAEGERGAEPLELLISNFNPDLMADIVIANMKHLPNACPPLTSRPGNKPGASQEGYPSTPSLSAAPLVSNPSSQYAPMPSSTASVNISSDFTQLPILKVILSVIHDGKRSTSP